jgi:CubicO group peptidase (beta-lactamase class C family)
MSVAKGLAGLVVAMLVDRGQLELDVPVTTYWPEFGKHGKEAVTPRQVLLHTAGVLGLPDVHATLGAGPSAWLDLDAIAAALADARPAWAPGTRYGYHAVTFGWLVGELVRRTDGRTLGTFFHEEVAKPLGVETAIGIDEARFAELAEMHDDRSTTGDSAVMRVLMRRTSKLARQRDSLLGQAFLGDGTTSLLERAHTIVRHPDWLRAEVPSSNGVTSAHDLARVFAVIARGGELDGARLISEKTLTQFMTPEHNLTDAVMMSGFSPLLRPLVAGRASYPKALGWAGNSVRKGWGAMGPGARTVGAAGLGGHVVIADPDAKVSAAFVRSDFGPSPKAQEQLLRALYSCLS